MRSEGQKAGLRETWGKVFQAAGMARANALRCVYVHSLHCPPQDNRIQMPWVGEQEDLGGVICGGGKDLGVGPTLAEALG